ncbi:MAG: uncharacterized protein QG656_1689 [Candidatus Hydrogenedentes bacterium]|nr:uncharacterized protein [Candidatus Hydrogenedentota bacterium]
MNLQPFPLNQVRLLDGPCLVAQEANRVYLHALEADRMLHPFRVTAGLEAPGEPLGGWEKPDCEVRGHFVGHYLSACALMYASAGDASLKEKADAMVAEFAKCQQANGGEYLAAYPQEFWDRLEKMERPPWAPYYTIHKIMAGLFDMYSLCGNQQALDVLKGMASYFKKRCDKLTTWEWDRMLGVEFGGMAEVLYNLYSVTQDPSHLDLAHAFDRAVFLGPLTLEHDNLTKIHANTHIPEIVGAARRYELLGDIRYRTASLFFWNCVVGPRTYITGGTSYREHWGDPHQMGGTLGTDNQESCTSYNMLRLTRHLLAWTGSARYGDYYELVYLNSILGTQRPSDGMLTYFTPLACNHTKTFGTPNDAFWCCYGTGIESFAKLGDSVYFHDTNGLFVNLFVPSEVNWPEMKVRIEQRTAFPETDTTTLIVHAENPVQMRLCIRKPAWAGEGFSVKVNGKHAAVEMEAVTYVTLQRAWKEGDTVEVTMPMRLTAEPLPGDPEMVAFKYGPVVLAGIGAGEPYLLADAASAESWLVPVEGKPLEFRTKGINADIAFMPLNRVIGETYGVYFPVIAEGSPRHRQILEAEEARRKVEARIIDRVKPLDEAGEKAHNLQGERTQAGPYGDRTWRHAADGGWFSWDLAVLPDVPVTLVCTYWGEDVPPRDFDVLVDGEKIATESFNRNKPGEFYNQEYALPEALTKGKTKITVKFAAHPGNMAGGAFECATLKPAISL